MEEAVFHDNPLSPEPASRMDRNSMKKARKIIAVLVIFVVITGIVFGLQSLTSKKKDVAGDTTVAPTPTAIVFPTDTPIPLPTEGLAPTPTKEPKPSVAPSPTARPTTNPIDLTTKLDRSSVSIAIQNGSGETGAASTMADILKSFGYKIVSLGNADNFDYENTVIKTKSDKDKFISLLKKDLGGDSYTIGNTSSDLSASSSADIVVIVGKL